MDSKTFVARLLDGYTEQQLSDAFDRVANRDDWKAPIDCITVADEVVGREDLIRKAVVFYTATEPAIVVCGSGYAHIQADGYRAGPAGP